MPKRSRRSSTQRPASSGERAPAVTSVELASDGPDATEEIGRRLGTLLPGGALLALVGDLGAGKTTLTRGLARGLGCEDTRCVTSPTYVLEQVYPGRAPIHHYDAYRLGDPEEFEMLGFSEHLGGHDVLIVEWADRVEDQLPEETLWIELTADFAAGPDRRRLRLRGRRSAWGSLLRKLAASVEEGA